MGKGSIGAKGYPLEVWSRLRMVCSLAGFSTWNFGIVANTNTLSGMMLYCQNLRQPRTNLKKQKFLHYILKLYWTTYYVVLLANWALPVLPATNNLGFLLILTGWFIEVVVCGCQRWRGGCAKWIVQSSLHENLVISVKDLFFRQACCTGPLRRGQQSVLLVWPI